MKTLKLVKLTAIVATLLSVNTFATAANTDTLTAAEVGTLATVATIDKGEVLISVIAENKKAAGNVTDFAKMMVEQHGSNLTQILEMIKHFHVDKLTGGDSEKLAAKNNADMIKLGGLEGNEFNQAYADAMVNGHQAALKLIDDHLMKTAKNDSVKQFLTDTRAAVTEHLEHAKKLQADMKS